eukprot:TRINITY_DN9083_c0_g1_i1.p1 TRINITY_DN9083_c0_g1~~TRINITY_DN9083_c0_g1_i1.p1  ORF type:complete len:738 (-),score=215.19 TRINITY_DN9083_c0_g1_i1:14-1966(-)
MEKKKEEVLFWDGKYTGELQNNKVRDGYGLMEYFTGEKYEGFWKDDKWNGEGKYYWKNGDTYVGNFKDMKRSGFGKLMLHNGNYYEGDFADDKMHGCGIYKWANKDVYEGGFKNGARCGFGTMTYANGNTYIGQWRENDRTGTGEWISPTEGTKTGIWKEGNLITPFTSEELLMDRLARNYQRLLSNVEENFLYQSLLALELDKVKDVIKHHEEEIKNLSKKETSGVLSLIFKPKDPYLTLCQISKSYFDFSNKTAFTFKTLYDKIKLTNFGDTPVAFHLRSYSQKNHSVSFSPNSKTLGPGASVKIKVAVTPLKPATVTDVIVLELRGTKNEYAQHVLILYYKSQQLVEDYREFSYSEISTGRVVGQGSFGVVHVVTVGGQQYAVKEFRADFHKISEEDAEVALMYFRTELTLAKMLDHKNIVKFIGACMDYPHLCIVMEYVPLQGLDIVLQERRNKINWIMTLKFALDIARGMTYLHSCNVIHRDLKSSNLLVASLSPDAEANVKITDFGISRIVDRTRTGFVRTMTRDVGTILWSAPEVLKREKYTEKADVYSFGVIFWELVARYYAKTYKSPYSEIQHVRDVRKSITGGVQLQIPNDCPADVRILLKECWNLVYLQRPTFENIVQRLEEIIGGIVRENQLKSKLAK